MTVEDLEFPMGGGARGAPIPKVRGQPIILAISRNLHLIEINGPERGRL